jgi:DNA-binding NarL/FixJ family response regulator
MSQRDKGAVIRVIVVDDHPLMLEATKILLAFHADIAVVGTAGTGSETLRLITELQPTVLVLDLRLPDISGIEVARQVRSSFPSVAMLVLTGYDDIGYVQAMLQIGVKGYLPKTATGPEIVAAVRTITRGGTAFHPKIPLPGRSISMDNLSARELEVARLLVVGQRNHEMADTLKVSLKTIEFHVSNILSKLKARSRAEAISKALALGITGKSD